MSRGIRVTTSNPRARTAKNPPRSVQRSVSQLGSSNSTCQTKRTASCSRRNYSYQRASSPYVLSIQTSANDHIVSSLVRSLSHTGSPTCFTCSTEALPMVVNTFRGWLPTTSASSFVSFSKRCIPLWCIVVCLRQKELDHCDTDRLLVTFEKWQ